MNKLLKEEEVNELCSEFKNKCFDVLENDRKIVGIFGSARLKDDNKYYQDTVLLSKSLSEVGFDVFTGGGPGIMEAACSGANYSYGLNIELPNEQKPNVYIDKNINFKHFSSRKVCFANNCNCYVIMPGGFGTIDEIGEILVLLSTGKLNDIKVAFYGVEFWKPFLHLLYNMIKEGCLSESDLNHIDIFDSVEEVVDFLKY